MIDPKELRELARACQKAVVPPNGQASPELQRIDRAIRELGLVEETRSFRFYIRDLTTTKRLVPDGHAWSLFSDGCAGCKPVSGKDMPIADINAATPELALLAAVLYATAAKLEAQSNE